MGIIRFYEEALKKDIVLYAIAYLQKVKLNLVEKKQLPSDNLYRYYFSDYGHLWFDLITSDKILGPLIGLTDPDSASFNVQNSLGDNIRNANKLRFIIQRPFFRDPTNTSKRNVSDFNIFVNNLLDLIPLPDENELKLFDYYAKSIKLNRSKIDYRVLDIPPDELEVDLDLMEF